MNNQQPLKTQLLEHLRGGQAFVPLQKAMDGIDYKMAGENPENMTQTIYGLVVHLYIAIKDINDYLLDENYSALNWPDDYWPDNDQPSEAKWDDAQRNLWAELERTETILRNDDTDLFAQIPWGKDGHTQLRGILLIIEHNAYHTGQILDIRKAIGEWH
jgi:uncharacterized damage-inducible protein DinB